MKRPDAASTPAHEAPRATAPFCTIDLARRIEGAAADLMRCGALAAAGTPERRPFIEQLAGGVATWAAPGSPLNKVSGLGFDGLVPDDAWERIEREFDCRRAPVQVELASLGDPAIAAQLTARGYRLVAFENVLGLELPTAPRPIAPGIDVVECPGAAIESWIDAIVDGFSHPDGQGVATQEPYPREVIEHAVRDLARGASMTHLIARIGTEVAGGASFCLGGKVAQLTGAATRPPFRRRGVQLALFEDRLARAARAGCDISVITTAPGSRSQQNAQARGFALLYVRAILVRDPQNAPGKA